MNILFVNYGDFTSNSLNHIGPFANRLTVLGHSCVVAVPENPASIAALPDPLFKPVTFARALEAEPLFPDRRPAEIIHAWTPRENVREFTLRYLPLAPAATLIVHLEDNEAFLIESYAHESIEKLRQLSDEELATRLSPRLSHPVRFRSFLRLAHGITYITDRLREFMPEGKPATRLLPGIDPVLYRPLPPDPELRREIGIRPDEKLIVFTGSTTFATLADLRTLLLAVRLINERGTACRLIRTGINPPELVPELAALSGNYVTDLGFVPKTKLASLLALADVLVQPGTANDFNDYRLPSKVPEFLCVGRPLVIPAANIAHEMEDGHQALLLRTGTPAEIADHCLRIFQDPTLAQRLSTSALEFAASRFDLGANTERLFAFYQEVQREAPPLFRGPVTAGSEDVLLATGDMALRMRAKEQSLVYAQQQLAERDGQIADLHANSAKQHETIVTLQAATVELRTTVQNQQSAIVELQQTIERLNVAIADLQAHNRKLAADYEAEKSALLGLFQPEKADIEPRHATISPNCLADQSELLTQLRKEKDAIFARFDAEKVALEKRLSESCHTCQTDQSELVNQLRKEKDAIFAQFEAEKAALVTAAAREKASHTEQYHYLRNQLQDARREAEVLRARVTEGLETVAKMARIVSDTRAQLQSTATVLQQKDDRISRMQSSLSWQVTAPLRWVRRTFADPYRRKHPAAVPAAAQPDIDGSFAFAVDQPTDWTEMPISGVLRGWLISSAGGAVAGVRLRAGMMEFAATYGLSRPDVAAAFPAHPHAGNSGFVIDYVLPVDATQSISLEALTEDDHWHCFVAPTVRGAANLPEHLRRDYGTWIKRFDTLTPERIARCRFDLDALTAEQRPLISIVMPVYNTPEKWLVKAIESVRAQLYPHWELCIADDASPAPHVRAVLDGFAHRDERIKVVYRPENGHISAASNSALSIAQGEFVALLDHDDELAPHALLEVVLLLTKQPNADFIYSDEDKIDQEGRRYDPYFKPDFLPDLFLAQNFTSHLTVYRLTLVRQAGGFRIGFEGSQDWDLALRVAELTAPERIRHVPKVLYHWRAIPGSTALALGEKNYPMLAARKALTEHFARRQESVELIREVGDYWRVKRPRPAEPPLVSLIIPTRDRVELLSRCVGSILAKTAYPHFEILIVDNGSSDPATLAYFGTIQSAGVRVLRYEAPFNFSAINNFAIEHAQGEVLGLLNNDLEAIRGDWLDEMVSHAIRPEIGCVGAMLYYPNDMIQQAGIVLGLGGVAGHAYCNFPRGTRHHFSRARLVQNYSAVTAACLVVRKEVCRRAGGFNETELGVAFNDVDFCLRVLKAGYRNLWTPYAELYHHESASRGPEDTPEKAARFRAEVEYMRATWGPLLDADPAYNPNLTLQQHDFSLAFPPR